jgi:porphobilinogen deaminase
LNERPIILATRGSALALAQANMVLELCRAAFPRLRFELRIVKTTGDKRPTAALAAPGSAKGLFTKELEVDLLRGRADLAVHSLKDLPTDLPPGLVLAAVGRRADAREVLICRDSAFLARRAANPETSDWSPGQAQCRGFDHGVTLRSLPAGAVVATSSLRRQAQVLALNPALTVTEIRGNVETRLRKLAEQPELDAILLAAAGLERLRFVIQPGGALAGDAVPDGLLAHVLAPELILPCVGQGAIGIEARAGDERILGVCARLNHYQTAQCVAAERAFLRTLGGGCRSAVAAHADVSVGRLRLRGLVFHARGVWRHEASGELGAAESLGVQLGQLAARETTAAYVVQ